MSSDTLNDGAPNAQAAPERVSAETAAAPDNSASDQRVIKELFFPTPIYFVDLENSAELNVFLKNRIYSWRDADQTGIQRSNVRSLGSWHSGTVMNQRPEYRLFVNKVTAALNVVYQDQLYSTAHTAHCLNMWANINPRGGYNRSHTHPGSLWSGVYYVQAPPDCGRVVFQDPRAQAQVMQAHQNSAAKATGEHWAEVFHQAVEGRLILFPSWLRHEVEPNHSALTDRRGDRISISFNYGQAPHITA